MTISSLGSPSLLASLLQNNSGTANSSLASSLLGGTATGSTASSASSGTSASDPAYTLSLGQQKSQTQSSLLGYGQLGQMVSQAATALGAIDRDNPAVTASYGHTGTPVTQTYTVDVSRLAQAQILTTGSYASPSQSVLGTGTLTLSVGSNAPVGIAIGDGSLNGAASAINAADAGVTATVVQASAGQYELQLAGASGAANAFSTSGIPALSHDPNSASFTGLDAIQNAQDAAFTVNGGASQTSATNLVTLAPGVTTALGATGTGTVSIPVGQGAAVNAASALVGGVNTLLTALSGLTTSGGDLSGDTGVASKLLGAIDQTANGTSLSKLGITVGSDGTLSLDSSKFAAAYAADPSGTRATLDKATAAIQNVLTSGDGAQAAIKATLESEVSSLMAQMPSLTSYLSGSTGTTGSSSASPLGGLMSMG